MEAYGLNQNQVRELLFLSDSKVINEKLLNLAGETNEEQKDHTFY